MFSKNFVLFSFLCIIPFGFNTAWGQDQKPNILVILADDLGWADVGWHGKEIKTPRLDKLANEGRKLEQFYVQPVCSPTRACLMTGRYPMRYGFQVGVLRTWADYGIPADERTLAQALRETGYYTALCGKWHLGALPQFQPNQRGFDYHYGFYLGMIDYYKHDREGGLDWHRNGKPSEDKGYSTDLIADDAVQVIRNHDTKKPLFLYTAFNAVHSPYQETPHTELNEQYSGMKNVRKIYAGMVSAMDAAVGRILDALEEKGIRDNTIIFFSSDNGGPAPGQVTDNGHLRGGKTQLYEGGVRVPAFAVWKNHIPAGSVSEQTMHIVDLYPTLLAAAGASAEQKHPVDGIDLTKTLVQGAPLERTEILLNAAPNTGALRSGNWKLVVNGQFSTMLLPKRNGNGARPDRKLLRAEVFNLTADPSEKNNLAETNPAKRDELLERFFYYAEQAVPFLNKEQPEGFVTPKVWGDE